MFLSRDGRHFCESLPRRAVPVNHRHDWCGVGLIRTGAKQLQKTANFLC